MIFCMKKNLLRYCICTFNIFTCFLIFEFKSLKTVYTENKCVGSREESEVAGFFFTYTDDGLF